MHLTPEQLDALRAVPLGEMPNKLRLALTLTRSQQVDIVGETGMQPSVVSDFLAGRRGSSSGSLKLTVDTAQKFADFFGCHIEDLFPSSREEVTT